MTHKSSPPAPPVRVELKIIDSPSLDRVGCMSSAVVFAPLQAHAHARRAVEIGSNRSRAPAFLGYAAAKGSAPVNLGSTINLPV